jgi:carbamoyl-phosphate synthase large subunit
VAPAQTLTDKEYQLMRDASVAIIRAIGVDTGARTSSSRSIRAPAA